MSNPELKESMAKVAQLIRNQLTFRKNPIDKPFSGAEVNRQLPSAIQMRNQAEDKKIFTGKSKPVKGGLTDLQRINQAVDDFLINDPKAELVIINTDHPDNRK